MVAFDDLSQGRGIGFGCLLAITTGDILSYWDKCRLGEWDSFLRLVRELDHAFMEHFAKKEEPKKP